MFRFARTDVVSDRVEPRADVRSRVEAVVREQLGARVTHFEPLEGALGRHLFARVRLESKPGRGAVPQTAIARVDRPEDAERRPTGVAPEPPLEPIRALLEAEGLPVPARYGADVANGIELLEDLGSSALSDVAGSLTAEQLESHYHEACSLIPQLQRIGPHTGVAAFERRLDEAQFAYKAERFAQFGLGTIPGDGPNRSAIVGDAFLRIAREVGAAPQRLAHRDLQSANLHVVDRDASREGARLVMIDLQGAFMAPPEYDLVCLLRDSYVALDDRQVKALLERVRPALPDAPDEQTFLDRFDLLTLTRKAKDHALYRYAAIELGDRRYLRFLPTTRRYLQAASARVAARDPRFGDLDELIQSLPESSCAP